MLSWVEAHGGEKEDSLPRGRGPIFVRRNRGISRVNSFVQVT